MNPWIKICANTNTEDARAAVAAGADALGFIFAPSPRRVQPEAVARIAEHTPTVERIGVFVNESAKTIAKIFHAAKLTGVQLHGDESPEVVQEVSALLRKSGSERSPIRIIKAVHFTAGFAEKLERFSRVEAIDALLVDAFSSQASGGTGQSFDWQAAREALGLSRRPIVLAGGLRPENVKQAISLLHPWGVDVASGVEHSPGKKDWQKLYAFCAAVRGENPAKAEAQLALKERV